MSAPVPVSSQERREKDDPYELPTPIPVGILLLVAVMVIFGMFYILTAAPDDRVELGDHRTVADLMAKPGGAKGGTVDGAAIFSARCAACHQATGQGVPGVFPPLAGSEWAQGRESLAASIVLHGVQGPITVKGTKYDGAMPAFKDQLDDASIAAVLTYVRGEWGNRASAIAQETVAQARAQTASHEGPWKGEAELAAMK
jgi:mono/diheme cytochrome c family protein